MALRKSLFFVFQLKISPWRKFLTCQLPSYFDVSRVSDKKQQPIDSWLALFTASNEVKRKIGIKTKAARIAPNLRVSRRTKNFKSCVTVFLK